MKKPSFFMVAVFFANVTSPALLGGIPSRNTERAVTTTNETYLGYEKGKG